MGLLKKNDYFAELKQIIIDKEKQVLFYNFFSAVVLFGVEWQIIRGRPSESPFHCTPIAQLRYIRLLSVIFDRHHLISNSNLWVKIFVNL